jgi:hypothetical protein
MYREYFEKKIKPEVDGKLVLPSVYRPRFHLEDESWARRLTQSPELGFGLWLFLFAERFWVYAAAGIAAGLLGRNGW